MWQYIVVGMMVVAAAVYSARKLGPRRWRAKPGGTPGAAGAAGPGDCGCDKDGKACH